MRKAGAQRAGIETSCYDGRIVIPSVETDRQTPGTVVATEDHFTRMTHDDGLGAFLTREARASRQAGQSATVLVSRTFRRTAEQLRGSDSDDTFSHEIDESLASYLADGAPSGPAIQFLTGFAWRVEKAIRLTDCQNLSVDLQKLTDDFLIAVDIASDTPGRPIHRPDDSSA